MTDQRRALLTEREREILTGEADVTDNYRYSVESRIRTRLRERLAVDVETIREHYPEMYDELLYPVVCEPGATAEDSATDTGGAAGAAESGPAPTESDTPQPSSTRDAAESTTSDDGDSAERETPVVGRPDVDSDTEAEIREHLRGELAGSGDLLGRRVDAILAMYAQLRDAGDAEKAELLSVVDADAVGYDSAGSAWSNMVKGKATLRALPGVESPSRGRSVWKYHPDRAADDAALYDPTEEF